MTLQPVRQVFIENPAGAETRIRHDEVRLVPISEHQVNAPYPYAYGFLPGIVAADGECLDCFVLGERPLKSGEVVDCYLIGLLEQFENDVIDHKVLAVPVIEIDRLTSFDLDEVKDVLASFIKKLFEPYPSVALTIGDLADASAANAMIDELLVAQE